MLRMARKSDGLSRLWISWKSLFLVLGSLSLLLTSMSCQSLTPEDAKTILDQHNDYRRQEGASNMYTLHWNMTLQERADGWARKCLFNHERNLDVGENLFFDADHENGVYLRGLKMWHDEKLQWRYTSDACLTTCHYTLMVTGYLTSMGCSANICPTLQVGGIIIKNAVYLVCYYYPRGNFVGHYPFVHGRPCSKCAEGDTCSNQLCVSSGPESKSAPDFIKSLLPIKPFSPHRPIKNLAAFKALLQNFGGSQTVKSSSVRHQHSHHRHHHTNQHHHSHRHVTNQRTHVSLLQSNKPLAQPLRPTLDRSHIHQHKPIKPSNVNALYNNNDDNDNNNNNREEDRRREEEQPRRVRMEEEKRKRDEQRKRYERERQAQRQRGEREMELRRIREEEERESQRLREQRMLEEQRGREERERTERERKAQILREEEQERETKRRREEIEKKLRKEQETQRLKEEQEAQRLREEQEAQRLREEQEAQRLREEQEAQRIREEQEKEMKRQEEELEKKGREEQEAQQRREEQEAQRRREEQERQEREEQDAQRRREEQEEREAERERGRLAQRLREERELEAKRLLEEKEQLLRKEQERIAQEERKRFAQSQRQREEKQRLAQRLNEKRKQELKKEREREENEILKQHPGSGKHQGQYVPAPDRPYHSSRDEDDHWRQPSHNAPKADNRLVNAAYNPLVQRGLQTSSDRDLSPGPKTPYTPVRQRSRHPYHHTQHQHHRMEETTTGLPSLDRRVSPGSSQPFVDVSTHTRISTARHLSKPISTQQNKQTGTDSNTSTRNSPRLYGPYSSAIYTDDKSTSGKVEKSTSSTSLSSVESTDRTQGGQMSGNYSPSTSGLRDTPKIRPKKQPSSGLDDTVDNTTSSAILTSSSRMLDLSADPKVLQKTPHSPLIPETTTPVFIGEQNIPTTSRSNVSYVDLESKLNNYRRLSPGGTDVRRTKVDGFVATIVKIVPSDPKRETNVAIKRGSSETTRNVENDTNDVKNRYYENLIKTSPKETVSYTVRKKLKRRQLRVKMSKLAKKRARKRRKRYHRRMLARLLKEKHPHKDKYIFDKTGRRCVDRLPRCSLWVAKCHKSAVVAMSCPLSCGKCGQHIDISHMLRDATKHVHDRDLFKTGRLTNAIYSGSRRRHKKRRNKSKNEIPSPTGEDAPQAYVLAPGAKAVDGTKKSRDIHRRRLKSRGGRRRIRKRLRKKGWRKRHRQNRTGLCRDSPDFIRSCRFWARRGFCEDNKLLHKVFCRWSCGNCD